MASTPIPLKIVILGDSGVGKTSLMNQYVLGKHDSAHRPTIGVDFLSRQLSCDEKPILIQIWDTAGQERFLSMGSTFLRGTEGAVIVFDVTDTKSFTNLTHWTDYIYSQLNLEKESTFPLLILGNKIDTSAKRTVEESLASNWAKERGFLYYETSARDNLNIEKAFKSLIEATLKYTSKAAPNANSTSRPSRDTIQLQKPNESSSDKPCCGK